MQVKEAFEARLKQRLSETEQEQLADRVTPKEVRQRISGQYYLTSYIYIT